MNNIILEHIERELATFLRDRKGPALTPGEEGLITAAYYLGAKVGAGAVKQAMMKAVEP